MPAKTRVILYRPIGDGSGLHESMVAFAEVRQGGRGDFDADGVYAAGGDVRLTLPTAVGARKDWYAVVGGQQFRVDGVEPLPPQFHRTRLTCTRNSAPIRVGAVVTVGGEALTEDGDELVVADGPPRRVGT